MGFRGTFEHAFDDKGRVSVPTRFRDDIRAFGDDRVVVTRFFVGSERCLDVYPHATWLELEEKFRERARFDSDIARFRRFYFSGAQDCVIDKQGRINVSAELREYARLGKDVRFVSDYDKFQMWDPRTWAQIDREDERVLSENPASLAALGI